MRNTIAILSAALILFPVSVLQADDNPSAYHCTFTAGTAWSYGNGSFNSKSAEPIEFDIAKIDLDAQSAELIARDGDKPAALKIVRAINANHFLEVVNEGFLNLTTVYDEDAATGSHPAVHSRHIGVLGQPVVGQYTGACTAK
jgi:hypothetical protein